MKPSELLFKAADVIRTRGHVKHLLVDRTRGCVCMFGALNVVTTGSPDDWPDSLREGSPFGVRYSGVNRYIAAVVGIDEEHEQSALVEWNNADERTPDDVIVALELAASAAAAEEAAQ